MALVWITVGRGLMAIVLGLALALHDRTPGASELHGRLLDPQRDRHLPVGPGGEGPPRQLPLAAGAIGIVTGAVVLVPGSELNDLGAGDDHGGADRLCDGSPGGWSG
jgi:hypothetical protein